MLILENIVFRVSEKLTTLVTDNNLPDSVDNSIVLVTNLFSRGAKSAYLSATNAQYYVGKVNEIDPAIFVKIFDKF